MDLKLISDRGMKWFKEDTSLGDDALPIHCTYLGPEDPKGICLELGMVQFRSHVFLVREGDEFRLVGRITDGNEDQERTEIAYVIDLHPDDAQIRDQRVGARSYAIAGATDPILFRSACQLAQMRRLPIALVMLGTIGNDSDARTAYLCAHAFAPITEVMQQIRSSAPSLTYI